MLDNLNSNFESSKAQRPDANDEIPKEKADQCIIEKADKLSAYLIK